MILMESGVFCGEAFDTSENERDAFFEMNDATESA